MLPGVRPVGKTEFIFFGAVIAVVALIALLAGVSGPIEAQTTSAVRSDDSPRPGSELVRFTGNEDKDVCVCYEQAHAYARNGRDADDQPLTIEGQQYRAGYSACSAMVGARGAKAWTDGWYNARERVGPTSCRGYNPDRPSLVR